MDLDHELNTTYILRSQTGFSTGTPCTTTAGTVTVIIGISGRCAVIMLFGCAAFVVMTPGLRRLYMRITTITNKSTMPTATALMMIALIAPTGVPPPPPPSPPPSPPHPPRVVINSAFSDAQTAVLRM